MREFYRHSQQGLFVFYFFCAVAFLVPVMLQLHNIGPAYIRFITPIIAGVFIWLFHSLTVTVDDRTVTAAFGPGLISRSVDLPSIRSVRVADIPWWVGYGVRWIPGGVAYAVSGRKGVELKLDDGRIFLVGSAEPEELCEAVAAAVKNLPFKTEFKRLP